MTLEKNKKPGVIDQLLYSVQPSKYKELAALSAKSVVFYMLILGLCLTIMDYVIPAAGWIVSVGGVDHFVTEVLPKIELKDGELTVADRLEFGQDGTVHLLADTSVDKVTESQINNSQYAVEILIGKKNALIYNGMMGIAEIDFSQLKDTYLDNETLLSLKPALYTGLAISFFMNLIGEILSYLIMALPIAGVGWAFGGVGRKNRMKFSKIYMLTLYAKTAAALFVAFNGSVNLIASQFLLEYAGIFISLMLAVNGVKKTEEAIG
ncbi:MAG: DUF1189 family protein [Lachnospiraceae bacterium]|nr:DUF1189 family protein [Lachnospiraceae bacterium]